MPGKPTVPHYSVESLKERLMRKSKLQEAVVTYARVSDLMFGEDALFARVRGATGQTITVAIEGLAQEEIAVRAARKREAVSMTLVRREDTPFMVVAAVQMVGKA